MTTAPGLSQAPWTNSAFPIAETSMSAVLTYAKNIYVCWRLNNKQLTISGRFLVRLWHWVTVASRPRSIAATGEPTMSLLPRTTDVEPAIGALMDSKRRITPVGVQGENNGSEALEDKWPILYAWNLVNGTLWVKVCSGLLYLPVNIFFWANCLRYGPFSFRTHMLSQRKLHQNTTNTTVRI